MFQKKLIGWLSLMLFVVATAILAILALLVFSPPLTKLAVLNPQALIVASGVLALAAAVLGFYAFITSPGRVGAIGGLVLFIAVAILLSSTTITTRIEGRGAQQTSPALPESPNAGEVTLESTPTTQPTEVVVVPQTASAPTAEPSTTPLAEPSFEAATYRDQSLGFEFDYPASWTVDGPAAAGDRADVVQFTSWAHAPGDISAETPAGGTRMTATVWQWDPKNDLEAFVANRQAAWEASGITVLSEERRDIAAGWPGIAFVIQAPDEQAYFFFTVVGDRYFSLSGSGNLSLLAEIGRTVRPYDIPRF